MSKVVETNVQTGEKRTRDLKDEEKVTYTPSATEQLNLLREERNFLLKETDWMSLPDAPTMSDAWKKYRQDLRDITKTYKSLDDVKWPTKPE